MLRDQKSYHGQINAQYHTPKRLELACSKRYFTSHLDLSPVLWPYVMPEVAAILHVYSQNKKSL